MAVRLFLILLTLEYSLAAKLDLSKLPIEIPKKPYPVASPSHYEARYLSGGNGYGYVTDDQYKIEVRHADGSVQGVYGYKMPDGKTHITSYVSDQKGYRLVENDILDKISQEGTQFHQFLTRDQEETKKEEVGEYQVETGPINIQPQGLKPAVQQPNFQAYNYGVQPQKKPEENYRPRAQQSLNQVAVNYFFQKQEKPLYQYNEQAWPLSPITSLQQQQDPADGDDDDEKQELEAPPSGPERPSHSFSRSDATSVAGSQGYAKAKGQATAIVGPNGLAVAVPGAQAYSGAQGTSLAAPTGIAIAGPGGVAISDPYAIAQTDVSDDFLENFRKGVNPSNQLKRENKPKELLQLPIYFRQGHRPYPVVR